VAAIVSGISTHILDTFLGRPAAGVRVVLERNDPAGSCIEVSTHVTDADGRVKQLLPKDAVLQSGQYRLTFHTQAYFDARGVQGLYPVVQVTFSVSDAEGHYHIPLLLTANGYSTYRGS
jgi:5-hydroxyisourate hydrolase